MCQKWFYNDCGAVIKEPIQQTTPPVVTGSVRELTIAIVGSCKEKEKFIKLGSVEKLVELWRPRRKNLEAKAEIAVTAFLAQYTLKAGETLMNKTMSYKSIYMFLLFKQRNKDLTNEDRKRAALIMCENYICQYEAIVLQCERDFDIMINVRLYQEIILPYYKSNMVNLLLLR